MVLVLLQNFLITVHFVSLIYFICLFTVVVTTQSCYPSYSKSTSSSWKVLHILNYIASGWT